MSITIKDVASRAGVSTATVSHVLNKTRYVAEETVKRVHDAARELGYVSNSSAKGLRSNKSGRIGLMVPNISNYFSVDIDIIEAIELVLRNSGYQVVIGCSHEDIEKEREQVDQFNFQQIEGMLMFPAPGDHSYLNDMPREYPIVFLDREASGCTRDCVVGNNEEAAFDLVTKLIEAGHKNIGVIDGLDGISSMSDRMRGYYRALEQNGIKVDRNFIKKGGSAIKGGYEGAAELLREKSVTAMFVINHLMTIGAMMCLIEKHIKIPEEIALVGVGDSAWAQITTPTLSVLRHPTYEIGKLAAQILLKRITGEETGQYRTIQLPIEFVKRQSF